MPQGSVLGPLLYSFLVLSLSQAGLVGKYYSYAGDKILVNSGIDLKLLESTINNDLPTEIFSMVELQQTKNKYWKNCLYAI